MPSESRVRVRYAETDQMGVAYHANYLVWCEVGRTDFIRQLGMTYAEMEARGFMLAVAEATVRYHAAARYDDDLRIETHCLEVRSRQVRFRNRITRAATGEKLATGHITLVVLDRDGRPTALPPEMRALLETDITPEAELPR